MENNTTKPFYNTTIPSDWTVNNIKEISNKITDGEHATPQRSENGFYLLSARNIQDGWISVDDVDFVDYLEYERIKKRCNPESGDILISCSGTIGRVAIVPNNFHAVMVRSAALIKPNHGKVHNVFLLFAIQSFYLQKQILNIINKGAQANLFINHIERLKIPLPPLPEQRAIAHVLSLMDSVINQNVQLIAQKELRKKWLMQNLLTGKKRLKGFDGEWKEVPFSNLFNRVTRKNTEENTNVVTISAQRGFVRQTDFFKKSIASEIIDNYFLVEKGEFCYNKSYSNGYPWGATKRLNDFDKAVVTTLYICFGIKDRSKTSGDFFEQYFEANLLDRGLTKIAHEGGRAHGLLNVTPADFFSLKITIPDFEEQTAIAQVLQAADKEIELLKAKTDKLREQKKGMMQVLLTGKVRIKSLNL